MPVDSQSKKAEGKPTNETWTRHDLSHFRNTTGDDVFDIHHHFAHWSEGSKPGGYDLYLKSLRGAPNPKIQLTAGGKDLFNLASYNYLGLSCRPEVTEAAIAAIRTYGLGAAGSPHLSGLLKIHEDLASEIAEFKQTEAALIFPSGYSANVGTLAALVGPEDWVIADINAHASIFDGCQLAGARLSLFRHNDMGSLKKRLLSAPGRKLVVVEGVYSMDGDIAPLDQVAELCQQYGARLMVDEAHSAFVYGENGRGLAEHFGVEDAVDVHFGTLSKSLGGMGGYVAGSATLIDYLRAYARSQVFSCALSPPVVGGLRAALAIARNEPKLRAKLWYNVAICRDALLSEGVDIGDSTSQVIPIMIRDDLRIFTICRALEAAGVYLNPVLYPAVRRNKSRFRVSLSAAHEPDELREGVAIIGKVLREHKVVREHRVIG